MVSVSRGCWAERPQLCPVHPAQSRHQVRPLPARLAGRPVPAEPVLQGRGLPSRGAEAALGRRSGAGGVEQLLPPRARQPARREACEACRSWDSLQGPRPPSISSPSLSSGSLVGASFRVWEGEGLHHLSGTPGSTSSVHSSPHSTPPSGLPRPRCCEEGRGCLESTGGWAGLSPDFTSELGTWGQSPLLYTHIHNTDPHYTHEHA